MNAINLIINSTFSPIILLLLLQTTTITTIRYDTITRQRQTQQRVFFVIIVLLLLMMMMKIAYVQNRNEMKRNEIKKMLMEVRSSISSSRNRRTRSK